jgi:hypothetical protein
MFGLTGYLPGEGCIAERKFVFIGSGLIGMKVGSVGNKNFLMGRA